MSGGLVARRGGQIVAGVIVAALLAEAAFWLRDRGAFPHLNCYVADPKLGVRLSRARPSGCRSAATR